MRRRAGSVPPAAAPASVGGGKGRPVQGASRQSRLSKELFFAGFPCQQPHPRTTKTSTNPVTPLSRQFVRGFFQQYGNVAAFFYDEARGMGSVVFADGADAESCYLAVHLSFIPTTTADGGVGQATWEQDRQGEEMSERRARPSDLLLCLEFAHCCPFVHPVLLTRDVFVDGGTAYLEVPGADLSRATLLHRFPQLLQTSPDAQAAAILPMAPRVVARWREGSAEVSTMNAAQSRVEVLEDDGDDGVATDGPTAGASSNGKPDCSATHAAAAVVMEGPTFPGRQLHCVEVTAALWRLLRPSHVSATSGAVVTVLDVWWEYFNLYHVHKTQPAASKVGSAQAPYRYAQCPSSFQEIAAVQRRSREDAHGDETVAQQELQRLVHDHAYHNVVAYLLVKQKFKYDPAWASLMRDLYQPKVVLQLEAWEAVVTATTKGSRESSEAAAPDHELRRRRVVTKAVHELLEPKPTSARDIEHVRKAEQTWLTLPRTTAAANLMENVKFLGKVKRGEVDRNGEDKDLSNRPTSALNGEAGGADSTDMQAAYPLMNARQRQERFYAEVLQNVDGYVGLGTAEELVSLCEDPKLFRYAKGHIGYEEAHQLSSYWRTYLQALIVPLIALLLLGCTSYYIVDRLGISKVNEKLRQEEQQKEFHAQLRQLLDQQRRMADAEGEGGQRDQTEMRAAMRRIDATMQRASEAARKAGGRFNIELRRDL